MNVPWSMIGNGLGGIGLIVALGAVLARGTGHFHVGGFESMTLFQGAIGLVVAACFCKLQALERR